MNIIRIARTAAIIGFGSFVLQACGTIITTSQTLTLMPKATATIVATSTHTATFSATLLPTHSTTTAQSPELTQLLQPTNRPCEIPNGIWESDEIDTVWPMIYPIPNIYLKIQFCMLRELDVYVHVRDGMEFIYTDTEVNSFLQFGSDNNPFFSLSFSNPDGPGSFSVYGKITPPDKCLGFVMFSKGFSLGGDPLTESVTITFHAKLIK
jgi:hypothetical protein